MKKEVSEFDLRMPEFRDPKLNLSDLEFDGDGRVVRKDRFEQAMRKISGTLHGVNGLSARTSWTCDQVVDANKQVVDELQRLKDLILITSKAPDDAEFYHFELSEYVKDVDKTMRENARRDPKGSHLVSFLSREHGGDWCENSGWIELIDALVSIDDLRGEIALIVRSGSNQ